MSDILVVGSLAYDTITTPQSKTERTLGGSANYFSLAASMYSKVRVVGVVGEDYGQEDLKLLHDRNVCTQGLQKKSGKTFHWSGSYKEDMCEATTLATELNVFAHFNPELPPAYKNTPFVFLANIDPELQLQVLNQIENPKFVGSDTMNFWINSKLDALKKVLPRVDVLLINEGESKLLTKKSNAISAAQDILKMGPKAVVIKRGEYGFVLYTHEGFHILPAFPIAEVSDPTGAGDSFAGAFFGFLSKRNQKVDIQSLKQACVQGCLMASFTVESVGVTSLAKLDWAHFEERQNKYQSIIS